MKQYIKFVEWTKLNIRLHIKSRIDFYFYEREIWWASIGFNIGSEQNGRHSLFERPVLVLKKFNKDILWILPLTKANKKKDYIYNFIFNGYFQSIILTQLRLISVEDYPEK